MATIRTLIVDNEPETRLGLRALLENDAQISLIGECKDGDQAVDAIAAQKPDLVLMDAQMPGINEKDVLSGFSATALPFVIFVTASDQSKGEKSNGQTIDYLLKPFTNQRFHEAIDQAKRRIQSRKKIVKLANQLNILMSRFDDVDPVFPSFQTQRYLKRIPIKNGERITLLNTDRVDWIEAADNYICLHSGAKSYLVRHKLSEIEKQLDPDQFLRIHRSRIVNIERIREMRPQGSGDCMLVLEDGTELASSRTYREQRRRLLNPL